MSAASLAALAALLRRHAAAQRLARYLTAHRRALAVAAESSPPREATASSSTSSICSASAIWSGPAGIAAALARDASRSLLRGRRRPAARPRCRRRRRASSRCPPSRRGLAASRAPGRIRIGAPFDADDKARAARPAARLFRRLRARRRCSSKPSRSAGGQMRFELAAAARARPPRAAHRPLIACSVRDILQETAGPSGGAETVGCVAALLRSRAGPWRPASRAPGGQFPAAREFADRIVYTGLVGPASGSPRDGAATRCLRRRGLGRRRRGRGDAGRRGLGGAAADAPGRRRAGWSSPVRTCRPPPEPAGAPDVDGALASCRTCRRGSRGPRCRCRRPATTRSRTSAGAGCRAVLVPYAAGGETEQTRRAALLAAARLGRRRSSEAGLDPGDARRRHRRGP